MENRMYTQSEKDEIVETLANFAHGTLQEWRKMNECLNDCNISLDSEESSYISDFIYHLNEIAHFTRNILEKFNGSINGQQERETERQFNGYYPVIHNVNLVQGWQYEKIKSYYNFIDNILMKDLLSVAETLKQYDLVITYGGDTFDKTFMDAYNMFGEFRDNIETYFEDYNY